MPRTRPAAALPKRYRFNQVCGIDTMEVQNPLDTKKKPIRIPHVICHGTRYRQRARRQDVTSTETFATLRRFATLRQFWLKQYDAMEVSIMDQGTEFGSDFQHLCQYRGILVVVTDLETPWQNSVVERACSLEAPTTEAEVDDLIDSKFAEHNRQVGRAGFSLVQPVFGRKFGNRQGCSRTTSSTYTRPNRTPTRRRRGFANGSRPRMRSRRRQQGDDDSSS